MPDPYDLMADDVVSVRSSQQEQESSPTGSQHPRHIVVPSRMSQHKPTHLPGFVEPTVESMAPLGSRAPVTSTPSTMTVLEDGSFG